MTQRHKSRAIRYSKAGDDKLYGGRLRVNTRSPITKVMPTKRSVQCLIQRTWQQKYWYAYLRTFDLMSWSDATLRNLAPRLKWTTEQLSFLRSCRMEQSWARCIERLLDNSEMLVLLHPGRLGYPSLWEDERFFRPLQPIVGVCSFEVEAYLAWLNYSSAQKYALPTEHQWESSCKRFVRFI